MIYIRSIKPLALSLLLCSAVSALSACGGGGGGGSSTSGASGVGSGSTGANTPDPNTVKPEVSLPVDSALKIKNRSEASLFLSRATFGGDQSAIDAAETMIASDWLTAEFAKPEQYILPDLVARSQSGEALFIREHAMSFWKGAVKGDDQFRQRMIFALSQIVVVSDADQDDPLLMGYYLDVLTQHAFGNYRDLLQDITYSPAMAQYLTYLRNRKGDVETGRMPDENYARELLQLFTLGLVELNMDGTPKTNAFGDTIELYDNSDITGLAKVFTGLSLKGTGFWSEDEDAYYKPLIAFDDKHSDLEKTFLGKTITAGTLANDSITQALDHIFAHPNMAPFISRQLIQRFTASHPAPDYVERVATAFETGLYTAADGTVYGSTGRGDMQAVLAAILLDAQFFDEIAPTPSEGKLREPVLKFAHWARAFNLGNFDPANQGLLLWTLGDTDSLGQSPFSSKSVFNFYRPGYIAPGTQSGAAGLTAPELQSVNEGSVVGYNNFMLGFVFDTAWQRDNAIAGFVPDYSAELSLVNSPEALVDRMDDILLAGQMSDATRARMIEAIGLIPIPLGDPDDIEQAYNRRVKLAVYMSVVSPEYCVQL